MSLNQLQTKAESALAAVSSIDEIDHLRIITKAGGSRKATPAQAATLLAPLLGMDYSKLEEQIVPGEFFPALNGVRSQVYTRTIVIKGTTAAAGSSTAGFVVFPNKKQLVSISGSYTLADAQYLIGVDYTPTLRKLEFDSLLNSDRVWYNLYSGASTSEAFTIVAVIKYIK